ncbi:MAG TPA: hypothetical protein VHA14_15105 [Bryobacteraceae bacterium]|nr:hypothetical protein [Bryobacteraceae bacterium]
MTRSLLPLLLLSALLITPQPVAAHIGPPFPIIENKKLGPVNVELWIHPDIGSSVVFVVVHPLPGQSIPKDLKMEVGVQPVSGRLKEALYGMWRGDTQDYVQYNSQVEFDRDEMWKVHLLVYSGGVTRDAYATVEATPTLLGSWELLFYTLPFAGVGFLWFKVAAKKKKLRRQALAAAAQRNNTGNQTRA